MDKNKSIIILMSDSHGDYYAVDEIVRKHIANADAFIHLGDGLDEFIRVVQKYMPDHYYYIPGNNDFGCIAQSAGDYSIITIGGRRILLTHGHRYHVKMDRLGVAHMAALEKADTVFYGHTHIARDETVNGIRIINPGAITYSRSGESSYALIEIEDGNLSLNRIIYGQHL